MAVQVGVMSRCCKSLDGLAYTQYGKPVKTLNFFDDFTEDLSNRPWYFFPWIGGAGAAFIGTAVTATRPGQILGETGATAAGYATLAGTVVGILFGGGQYVVETDCYLSNLSTAVEEFVFYFGFGDQANVDETDGAYFQYDRTLGLNWLCCTANNGVRTKTNSLIPVVAGAFVRLKVVVNYAGTAVNFYINDVLVATNILNIPTGAGRNVTPIIGIVKSVGITSRYFVSDWVWYHQDLTVSR
jgi:hypothetical protein